ncbi:metallopeptidase TldD-related protein [Acidithiobacillus ferrivorans]|uniref:Metalloprotease TldD/E C-terminal domain-containing protein n=1 Tax=Acidithiobacillus ferrivorans TaxID=160808 RepID=A0A7T5BIQ7_9PROT|nr:metallopeptidase TldD-related protein [Acidithiobacillus ferrivorans]MBN6740406.1 hypothetical protein [Acidithiobacillus sp. MC6.1]QQD73870.1 hypothetical protein H2515_06450 [Acidithiobacillus ferrivorans]
MMSTTDQYIHELPGILATLVRAKEQLFARIYVEKTQYARLTQARVNQSGAIHQSVMTLSLSNGEAMVSMTLEGELPYGSDLKQLVTALRDDLSHVPADPWLNLSQDPQQTETGALCPATNFEELVTVLCGSAGHHDLVGLVLAGPQTLAVCSSLGHCLIHRGGGSSVDVSFFDPEYNAVKRVRSQPDIQDISALMDGMARDLNALQRPAVTLKPDTYRAWLSAEALAELLGTMSWSGFSIEAIQSGSSPLKQLYSGEKQLAGMVTLHESRQALGVPQFTDQGYLLPAEVPLISAGTAQQSLASPRAAREFDVAINSDGAPMALHLHAGDLLDADVLRQIGTGLYIGRLWYTNISDPASCRLTAMTRYDCYWVDQGELTGPLVPVRVDSSLYQLLGSDLEALGATLHRIPETHSYGSRSWGGTLLPGAMTTLKITL